jgi:hypothetical protein
LPTVLVVNRLQPLVLRGEATLWAGSARIPIVTREERSGVKLGDCKQQQVR